MGELQRDDRPREGWLSALMGQGDMGPLDEARVFMGTLLMAVQWASFVIFAAASAGVLWELIVLAAVAAATWLHLSGSSGIGPGWLSGPARHASWLDRLRRHFASPIGFPALLAAYPPLLAVIGCALLTNDWRPPTWPLTLYGVATLPYGLLAMHLAPHRDDDHPESTHAVYDPAIYDPAVHSTLPWLRRAASFMQMSALATAAWLFADASPYFSMYF